MSRGVSFERVLEFFDNAPLRVAQAAVTQAVHIVGNRKKSDAKSAKRQAAAVSVPRKRRSRGTNSAAALTTESIATTDLPPSA